MTSPPHSETEPTPEEQAMIHEAVVALGWGTDHSRAHDPRPILTRLVSAAKRSAHLEDARVGCADCVEGDPVNVDGGWFHICPQDGAYVSCERHEVWDALSLLSPREKPLAPPPQAEEKPRRCSDCGAVLAPWQTDGCHSISHPAPEPAAPPEPERKPYLQLHKDDCAAGAMAYYADDPKCNCGTKYQVDGWIAGPPSGKEP